MKNAPIAIILTLLLIPLILFAFYIQTQLELQSSENLDIPEQPTRRYPSAENHSAIVGKLYGWYSQYDGYYYRYRINQYNYYYDVSRSRKQNGHYRPWPPAKTNKEVVDQSDRSELDDFRYQFKQWWNQDDSRDRYSYRSPSNSN